MKNITGNYESNLGNQIEIWKGNRGHLINIIKEDKTIGPFDVFGVLPSKILVLAERLSITVFNDKVIQLDDNGKLELFSKI